MNDDENKGMIKLVRETDRLIQDLRVLRERPEALIIEDDPRDRELMTDALETMGCNVHFASNGNDAISALRQSLLPQGPAIQIVFLDIWLPGGPDGIEVLKAIRTLDPAVPVIIVTGAVTSREVAEAAKLGYVSLIEKPLSPVDVREILLKHRISAPPASA